MPAYVSLLGPEASAAAIARAMSAGSAQVDIESNLVKAGLQKLGMNLRVQPSLFQLMQADNEAAAKHAPAKVPFTYIDFTHKDMLPLWLPSEAIGGHTTRPGEIEWAQEAQTSASSLAALGRALKGAMEKPRWFRSMSQWSAVWMRFAPVAVAMGQWTWPRVLAHSDQMYQLAEEARANGASPSVVFIYDDLLRKSIATRAEWSDATLDLDTVFNEIDKKILEAAKSRLTQMGVGASGAPPVGRAAASNVDAHQAQQLAEAERVIAKATQASKDIAKQQALMNAKAGARGEQQGHGGRSNKQLKAESFFAKKKDEKGQRRAQHSQQSYQGGRKGSWW